MGGKGKGKGGKEKGKGKGKARLRVEPIQLGAQPPRLAFFLFTSFFVAAIRIIQRLIKKKKFRGLSSLGGSLDSLRRLAIFRYHQFSKHYAVLRACVCSSNPRNESKLSHCILQNFHEIA